MAERKPRAQCLKEAFPHQYAAKKEAERQMHRLRRVRNHVPRLHEYLCTECDKWHITHST